MRGVVRVHRRGQAAVWAGSLLTLLGFAAIVVDLGYARSSDAQLDAIAEAAAMGGAGYLDGTVEGLDNAEANAIDVAAANSVNKTAVVLTDPDVEVGIWDADTKTFAVSSDEALVNAVRVVASRNDIATFFSRLTWGTSSLSIAGSAIAKRGDIVGAGSADCFLPLALPDCLFSEDPEDVENLVLRLQPAGGDNVGWGRMNAAWDNSFNKAQIEDTCAAGAAYVGDPVFLGNGLASSSIQSLDDVLEASTTSWNSTDYGTQPPALPLSTLANYGHTMEAPIILFDDDSYCADADSNGQMDGGSFTGSKTTTGFGWGVIFDVVEKGTSADRNLQMHIDLTGDHHVGTTGGGGNFNVTYIGNTKEVQ